MEGSRVHLERRLDKLHAPHWDSARRLWQTLGQGSERPRVSQAGQCPRRRVADPQTWPLITADKIPSLRGKTTRDLFPITLDDIYTQSDECHRATIAKEMAAGSVTPQCDGTTSVHPWPPAQALTASGDIPSSPLDALCHWNIPIIEPSIPGVAAACTKQHGADSGSLTGPESEVRACVPANTASLIEMVWYLFWDKQEFPVIGPAAWYGRAMFYPKKDCTCKGKPILYKEQLLTCKES